MRARKQGMFGIFEKIDSQYLQQASDTLIHYITLVSGGTAIEKKFRCKEGLKYPFLIFPAR